MEEQEKTTTETKEESPKQEKKDIIWGQLRVPNIKKGVNTTYPFIMMGIVVIIFVLSFIFANFSS